MKTEDYTDVERSQLAQKLQSMQHRIGDTARNVSRVTDRYVHDNPWRTVAIVAITACALGFLVRGRRY